MKFFKRLINWHANNKIKNAQEAEEKELFDILLASKDRLAEIELMIKNGYQLDFIDLANVCRLICNRVGRSSSPITSEEAQMINSIIFSSINTMKKIFSKNPFYFPTPYEVLEAGNTDLILGDATANLYLCCNLIIKQKDLTLYSLTDRNKIFEEYKTLLLDFTPINSNSAKVQELLSPIMTEFDRFIALTEREIGNKLNKVTQKMQANNFAPITSAKVQKMIEKNSSSEIEKKCIELQNKILFLQHEYTSFIFGDDKVFLDKSLAEDIPQIISSYSATPKILSDKYLALSGETMEGDLNKLLFDIQEYLSKLENKYVTSKAQKIQKEIKVHGQYLHNIAPSEELLPVPAAPSSQPPLAHISHLLSKKR